MFMSTRNKIYTLDEIKRIAQPVFASYDSIKQAYLFGSYARNEATRKSDLDFMIVLKDDELESLKDELRVQGDLMEIFNKHVDTIRNDEVYEIMPRTFERDKILVYEQENKD